MGILKGKRDSCYPTFENELLGAELSFNSVVISGNTITSRGPGNAIEFALAIVSQLKGESVKKEVAQGLLYTL